MLEIVKLKNPFDRTRREAERVVFIPGQVLSGYVEEKEVEFVLNGNFVEFPNLTFPADGDQVIVMPHVGSSVLRMVLTIALMAYVGGILGSASKAGWFFSAGHATLATYLAAGTVMYVGGRIINTICPVNQGLTNSNSSQTYGWDTPSPISGEGGIVGVTYGECMPAPQILAQHVETVGDKQYLNLLLCGGLGPIDGITDIKINDTAIADYNDVEVETRLGTNDQEAISFFTDTPLDQSVGVQLTESGHVVTSDSTKAVSLEATIEFPSGLYKLNDSGSFANDTVKFQMMYRKYGDTDWIGSGGISCSNTKVTDLYLYDEAPAETWTISCVEEYPGDLGSAYFTVVGSVSGKKANAIPGVLYDNGLIKFKMAQKASFTIHTGDGTLSVTAKQNTAVRKSFRMRGLVADKYEIKLLILSRNTGSRYCNTCTWSILTSYQDGQYARPNKVLVGLRLLATDQISGSLPDITWRQKRNTVYVWNPDTVQYETRSANNPVWAAYDIYHQCRYLKNINTGLYEYTVFGVAHTRLDPYWDEWVDAAAYADEQILGLDGVTYENRFEFDAFYDTAKKRYEAAQLAATVGHCVILPRGNNIGIKCDKPGTMVQIFGEGRTTMSSLQGTFSAKADRALAVEVVYSDSDKDFVNTQFLVRSNSYNSSTAVQDNPAQLQLFGVKRRSQAYREGVYTLANNELITQFVDISTDIDAMVCSYGDIVGLNHSVAQIGMASGRLAGANVNQVKIDKTVTLEVGKTYQIIMQSIIDDSLITKNIAAVSEETTTDILTLTDPFTTEQNVFTDQTAFLSPTTVEDVPIFDETKLKYSNYVFGETGNVVKKFRLVGVERDGDLRCKLNLAEYSEDVYTGGLDYPLVDYPSIVTALPEVTSLSLAEEDFVQPDGTAVMILHASWGLARGDSSDAFYVYYSADGANYVFWERTQSLSTAITGLPAGTYYVKVCTANSIQQSGGTFGSITMVGKKSAIPSTPAYFTLTTGKTNVTATFTKPADPDIDFYEIRTDTNTGNVTNLIIQTASNNLQVTLPSRNCTVYLYAHNRSGTYSAETHISYTKSVPVNPTNLAVDKVFQGLKVTFDAIPADCRGANVYVNDTLYFTENNYFSWKASEGTFNIKVAYVDQFGEGSLTSIITQEVIQKITYELLEADAVTADNITAECITAEKINWSQMPNASRVRNCILAAKMSRVTNDSFDEVVPRPDFLSLDSGIITIKTTETFYKYPFILSFADFFQDTGDHNHIEVFENNIVLNDLISLPTSVLNGRGTSGYQSIATTNFPNSKYYLFARRNRTTGVISFGSSANQPYYNKYGFVSVSDRYAKDMTSETIWNCPMFNYYGQTMTSNTAPFNTCSAYTNNSTAYKARTDVVGDYYTSTSGSGQWWQYTLDSARFAHRYSFTVNDAGKDYHYKITASNDGSTWYDLSDYVQPISATYDVQINVTKYRNVPFLYHRIVLQETGILYVSAFQMYREFVHYFDTQSYMTGLQGKNIFMNNEGYTQSITEQVVYIGEYTTNGTGTITSVTPYNSGDKYDTGWFDVKKNTLYDSTYLNGAYYPLVTNMGVNTNLQKINIMFRKNKTYNCCPVYGTQYNGSYFGAVATADTPNTIKMQTANNYVSPMYAAYVGAADDTVASGQYRIIVDRGF